MSFEKAKADLEEKGLGDHVIVLNESSATVAEAAHALGVEPASIAKTLSVLQGEKPVLIVTEGTAKLDNHKYKSLFHIKAKMIPYDEVEAYVGHAPGGVCPFGVNEGVAVYLDESLRKFNTVYPAAGNGHTAVKLTLQELEAARRSRGLGGCLQGAGRRVRHHIINAKGVLPGPSSVTELPFCRSHAVCGGGGTDPGNVAGAALQRWHGVFCGGLQRDDGAGCGTGVTVGGSRRRNLFRKSPKMPKLLDRGNSRAYYFGRRTAEKRFLQDLKLALSNCSVPLSRRTSGKGRV